MDSVDGRVVGRVAVETARTLRAELLDEFVGQWCGEDVVDERVFGRQPAEYPQCADIDATPGQIEIVAHMDALTRPHTTWSGSGGIGMMRSTTHSNEIGAPAMRGADTTSDGAFSSPSAANSSTSVSNSKADRCTASACPIVVILTTNSLVSRILTNVSLRVTPSERGCSEIDRTGGNLPTTVKKDTGAILPTPVTELVLTHAIARGQHAADEQFVAGGGVEVCGIDDHGVLLERRGISSMLSGQDSSATALHQTGPTLSRHG